jgi:hypothetical protein
MGSRLVQLSLVQIVELHDIKVQQVVLGLMPGDGDEATDCD